MTRGKGGQKKHSLFLWVQKRKCFGYRANPEAEKSRIISLSGAIPSIKRCFFKNYNFNTANLVTSGTQNQTPTPSSTSTAGVNSHQRKDRRLKGTALGLLVCRQLEKTVDFFHRYSLSAAAFCKGPEARQDAAKMIIRSAKDKNAFNKWCKTLHSYTEMFWAEILRRKLRPYKTECIVGSVEHGVATAVDVVCLDPMTQKYTLIEVKTNYTHYLNKCTSRMMSVPFQDLTDSPLHQHYLQLLLTYDLYIKTNPSHYVAQALLVRLDTLGTHVTCLPSYLVTRRSQMMSIIKHNNETRIKATPTPKPKPKRKAESIKKTKPVSIKKKQRIDQRMAAG